MDNQQKLEKAKKIQEKLVSQIQHQNTDSLKKLGDLMFTELVEKKQPNRIPERVFVQAFLPVFLGESKLANTEDTLINWIAIAGDPFSPVIIMNDKGEELFQVPPVMDSSVVDPRKPLQQSISDFITTYKLKTDYVPAVGQRYALETTAKIMTEIGETSKLEKTTETWDLIRQRYRKDTPYSQPTSQKIEDDLDDFELRY